MYRKYIEGVRAALKQMAEAKTAEEHDEYAKKGYTHEKPINEDQFGTFFIKFEGIKNPSKVDTAFERATQYTFSALMEDADIEMEGEGEFIGQNIMKIDADKSEMKNINKFLSARNKLAKETQKMVKKSPDNIKKLYEKRADHFYVTALLMKLANPNTTPKYSIQKFMKESIDINEAVTSADKKPENVVGPDGKMRVRMVPVTKKSDPKEEKYHIPEDIPQNERTAFHGAAAAAAKAGKKSFNFGGKTHPVTMKKDVATKIADQTEATHDTDFFIGHKHAAKAGMKVKVNSKGPYGDNVTISHSDPKKLQKYVDNHLGGGKVKEKVEEMNINEKYRYTVDLYHKDHGTHDSFIKKAKAAGIKGAYSGVNSAGKVKVSLNHHDNSDGGTIHKFLKKHYDKDMTHGNMQTMQTGGPTKESLTYNEETNHVYVNDLNKGGLNHAKKAGMTVTHHGPSEFGHRATISHNDSKKLAKYVDRHLGGMDQVQKRTSTKESTFRDRLMSIWEKDDHEETILEAMTDKNIDNLGKAIIKAMPKLKMQVFKNPGEPRQIGITAKGDEDGAGGYVLLNINKKGGIHVDAEYGGAGGEKDFRDAKSAAKYIGSIIGARNIKAGVEESTIRERLTSIWEEAGRTQHYKGATKPEPMTKDDERSAKKMKDGHSTKKDDHEETSGAAEKSTKPSAMRGNDNKQGDKNIIPSATKDHPANKTTKEQFDAIAKAWEEVKNGN